MAIAQRHIAPPFHRTLVLPRSGPRTRAHVRKRSLQLQASLIVGSVAAAGLVTYVCGYARMTAANYQRYIIKQELQKLRAQNQLMTTTVYELRNKDKIESWALVNNMAPASGAPLVIRRSEGR